MKFGNNNLDSLFYIANKKYANFFNSQGNLEQCKSVSTICLMKAQLAGSPLISILVPTFQREQYLFETLKSIANQKCNILYEVIVVDNDPDSKVDINILKEILGDRVSYYRNSHNIGMVNNWNKCALFAHGEWIVFIHDDDVLDSNYLSIVSKAISGKSAICIKFQKFAQTIDISLYGGKFYNFFKIFRKCYFDYFIGNHQANFCLYNRDAFWELGGFNDSYFPISDYALITKYHLKYGSFRIDTVLAYYRVGLNESSNKSTVKGFVLGDYFLRKELLVFFPRCFRRVLSYYNDCRFVESMESYAGLWNVKFLEEDYHDIFHSYPRLSILDRIFLRLIKVLYKLKNIFFCIICLSKKIYCYWY